MKAQLTENGELIVTAETIPEVSALRRWVNNYYHGDRQSSVLTMAQEVQGHGVLYTCGGEMGEDGEWQHES